MGFKFRQRVVGDLLAQENFDQLEGGFDDVEVRLAALEVVLLDPVEWTAFPLAGGWASYGAGYEPRYRRDALGMVHLEGLIKHSGGQAGSTFSLIGTMPVGFRPAKSQVMKPIASYSGGAYYPMLAYVDSNGGVNVFATTPLTASGYHDISNLSWLAEQ